MSSHTENITHAGHEIGHGNVAAEGTHGHGGHDDHPDDNVAHGTMADYVKGFVLSIILTAIPFWLVMGDVFDNTNTTALVIMGFAVVQIVVHMVYFLHMNFKSEGGWNMLALIFTIVIVVITLAGSIWVMYHLNANMMPAMMHDMKNMP